MSELECRRCGIVFAKVHDVEPVFPPFVSGPGPVAAESTRLADPTEPLIQAGRWLLVGVLAWFTFQFASAPLDAGWVNENQSFLHLPNLVFHEAGHVIFSPLGQFVTVLGGSLFQVLVPLLIAGAFIWQQSNRFGGAVMLWWAGQNLTDVAPYIADARLLQLVLLGGHTGAEVEGHDWEYLLTALGWLHHDIVIGRTVHAVGTVVMGGSVVWAIALLWRRPGS